MEDEGGREVLKTTNKTPLFLICFKINFAQSPWKKLMWQFDIIKLLHNFGNLGLKIHRLLNKKLQFLSLYDSNKKLVKIVKIKLLSFFICIQNTTFYFESFNGTVSANRLSSWKLDWFWKNFYQKFRFPETYNKGVVKLSIFHRRQGACKKTFWTFVHTFNNLL